VQVGGNIGTPLISLVESAGDDTVNVVEVSSFQLEAVTSFRPRVAALLNITPDHLDRHGGLAGYIAAKTRIFGGQRAPRAAVVGVDDEPCRTTRGRLAAAGAQRVIPISAEGAITGGVYAHDGQLVDDRDGRALPVLELAQATNLPGRHNWQNAAAAFAACAAAGVATAKIVEGLRSYPGLAHRQELIATIGGVRYVNDSKATNADAAAKALACYAPIYWILGGRAKETGLDGLEPFFPRIAHAFLIGEATERFAAKLAGHVAYTKCGTLAAALSAAHRMAQDERRPGAVVLLSPACASFDQFADFEERGAVFRQLVEALCVGPMQANGGTTRRRAQ
jgi:UDP-N-acetylmuramoylalanine--D-glutamate ligase